MALNLGRAGVLGFTEQQARNKVADNETALYTVVDFIDGVGMTEDMERDIYAAVFKDLARHGNEAAIGAVDSVARQFGVTRAYAQSVIDNILDIVRQIKEE